LKTQHQEGCKTLAEAQRVLREEYHAEAQSMPRVENKEKNLCELSAFARNKKDRYNNFENGL